MKNTLIGNDPINFEKISYSQDFENLTKGSEDVEEKKAFRALLCFWGNATVTGDAGSLAGLPMEFIQSLKYTFIDGSLIVTPGPGPGPGPIPGPGPGLDPNPSKPKVEYPQVLLKQLEDIEKWAQDKTYILQSSNHLRKNVSDFLQEAVNWTMEGIPTYWADMYLKDNKKVYIEGQKEKVPTADTALIILPRSMESSYVLKGLAIRYTLRHWDFDESAFYQQRIAIWLEKNRREFVHRLSGQGRIGDMKELLMASMTAEYLYLAIMGGFNRDEAHLREKLFKQKNELLAVERGRQNKRYEEWGKLIDALFVKTEENHFKDNKEILTRMIKSTTGEALATSDNVLIWGEMVDEAFNMMKRMRWDFSSRLEGKVYSKDILMEKPYYLLQEYWPKVMAVLEDEKNNFNAVCEKLLFYVDNPEDSDSWKEVAKKATQFLKNLNGLYGIAYPGDMENALQKVKNTSETLAAIVRNGKAVCESGQPSSMLIFFSSDPISMNLEKAVNAFDSVKDFAEAQRRKYEGAMSDFEVSSELDEAIEKTKDKISNLMNALSGEVE